MNESANQKYDLPDDLQFPTIETSFPKDHTQRIEGFANSLRSFEGRLNV